MIFSATSWWSPRPNCATLPVICMSVSTRTRTLPFPSSCRIEVMVAEAVPCPRASLPSARITARCSDSSASSILTVPLYLAVTGPILTDISPLYSSPTCSVSCAPGKHGVTFSRSFIAFHASSIEALTVNSFSSFIDSSFFQAPQVLHGVHVGRVRYVVAGYFRDQLWVAPQEHPRPFVPRKLTPQKRPDLPGEDRWVTWLAFVGRHCHLRSPLKRLDEPLHRPRTHER